MIGGLTWETHDVPRPRPPADAYQPSGPRDLAVSLAARPQPGGLVSVGPGGLRAGAARGPADLPVGRVLDVLLVPRDGAAVLRGRTDCRRDEPAVRQHQGGPGG